MRNNSKILLSHISSIVSSRASMIKLKINGVCVNKCVFCPFHNDRHLLESRDLAYFFDMIEKPKFHWIVISGGEPTIHPRFMEICHFLKERFKGSVLLALGTNLIPLSRSFGRYPKTYRSVLKTFDRIEVGCDDEHKNIDILENLAPEIIEAGLALDVNVVTPYCSDRTKHRILALRDRLECGVSFSEVHHCYSPLPYVNDISVPCRRRVQYFMLDCNGNGYFCFLQEMENPLFNLFTVNRQDLNYYLNTHLPKPYRFCASCPGYKPERLLHRLPLRDLPIEFLKKALM